MYVVALLKWTKLKQGFEPGLRGRCLCAKGNAKQFYHTGGGLAWSSGYGMRLMFLSWWVQIPAPYNWLTFLTRMCCKNCNVCLNKTQNKYKETEDVAFIKNTILTHGNGAANKDRKILQLLNLPNAFDLYFWSWKCQRDNAAKLLGRDVVNPYLVYFHSTYRTKLYSNSDRQIRYDQ